MSIKDILVHVDVGDDGGDGAGAALQVAVDQARRFGARLTGLFARKEILPAAVTAGLASETLLAAAARAKAVFDAAATGLETRWWQIEHGAADQLVAEAVFCAHYVDLVVVTQPVAGNRRLPPNLVDKLILSGGRPVLVVPAAGRVVTIGNRTLIGWRSGKEAARAVQSSLPFLTDAEHVVVASVGGPMGGIQSGTPKVDIIDHLRAHGLPVAGERIHIEDLGVMDALLSRAYDLDCDLLVMGGHAGRALSFSGKAGAGTRHILLHAGLPVLFAG